MRGREWAALWGLSAALLAGAAVWVTQPGYMDAHYYFGGAVQLARGRGFTEPYLWNYLAPMRSLPAPSHLYWMPLTSIVAAPFLAAAEWAAGRALPNAVLFHWAQAPLAAAAAGLAVLTGWVSWRTTGLRRHAWAAGLLTLFSVFYFPFWLTTDSFALFGLAAAGALLCGASALGPLAGLVLGDFAEAAGRAELARRARRGLLAAGLLAGLAHLARADGGLVLFAVLIFLLLKIARGAGPRPSADWARAWPPLVFLGLGYLVPMLPWFLRNLAAVGAPLAPGGTRALWLIDYADLF
ncbi:MAG: hypothetical protein JNK29_03650, partial [Anaerolineales bacterium]|nr:hypothetical protein [Anaerolineales bacterium]